MNWESIFKSLSEKEDLPAKDISWAMSQILQGAASIDDIKHFLLSLKEKGESAEEVKALVDQMLAVSSPINIPDRAVRASVHKKAPRFRIQ